MDALLATKVGHLRAGLSQLRRVIVAYSGGVDSAYLMSVAHDVLGGDALAVTASSPSLAKRELEAAAALARAHGWQHRIVPTEELAREEYARNAADRCYWCKIELLDVLAPLAAERAAAIAVGTNVDDLSDHRPGSKAVAKRSAVTPLADAGLTKREIRSLSDAAGLPTADKPASPCLASRFAYGVRVTEAGLRRIEAAEERLRGFGFEVLRVRDHGGDLARVEVPVEDIPSVIGQRDEIEGALAAVGFRYVTLDLKGFRSGSMNEVLPRPRMRSASP